MKIKTIKINNFRSILNLLLDIDVNNDFISICGQNNSGKTNVFRAMRLFFKPDSYVAADDTPYYKYEYTRGANAYPSISITFCEDDGSQYIISRKFNLQGLETTKGSKKPHDKSNKELTEKECKDYIDSIKLYLIESVNISIPDLISDLTEDLFDAEFGKSVFKGAKAELKTAFDKYIQGLNSILQELSDEINPMFHDFHEKWNVSFGLESDVKRFRDLISADINFNVLDGSNNEIDSKGAGLQRLAFILLHVRIIEKTRAKRVVLMIDEPDVFLHPGMQKKLYFYLKNLQNKSQVFVTTHSKVFIDTYRLSNVFLLKLNVDEQFTKRKNKNAIVLSTTNVALYEENGTKEIKQYLGIEDEKSEYLDKYNVLVEGDTDQKYLSELMRYYELEVPNFISAHGADNIIQQLELYNSLYKDNNVKPTVMVLLDNDTKGREICKKIMAAIKKGQYINITVKYSFVANFIGDIQDPSRLENIQTNNEIEDLIYPNVFCYLLNKILKKAGLKSISEKTVCTKISKKAFSYKGIMDLCETEKNNRNPDDGNIIVLTINNRPTVNIKNSIANSFRIESDYKLINLLKKADEDYPEVRKFVEKVAKNLF